MKYAELTPLFTGVNMEDVCNHTSCMSQRELSINIANSSGEINL